MTTTLNVHPITTPTPNVYRLYFPALMLFASLALLPHASACTQIATPVATVSPLVTAATMPLELRSANRGDELDSSSSTAVGLREDAGLPENPVAGEFAPIYTKYIPAGERAQSINARDKVVIGLRDLYSPSNFGAIIIVAGYEHVLNGQPNYGTDRGAFGERLGAAGIRETTQGVFTDSIFAPLLHEDPRYYVEGSQYGFIHRAVYAATRPLITRTDSGRASINGSLLLGYAASSAVTYTYYPKSNQNFHDTASTFGGAIGGAALGFFVSEFTSDVLVKLHLQKKQ
jgi:hypothetical protein